MNMRTWLLILLLSQIGWAADVSSAEIPVEVMFQRAKFGAIKLSPNGDYLAAIVRLQDRNNLAMIDLKPGAAFDKCDYGAGSSRPRAPTTRNMTRKRRRSSADIMSGSTAIARDHRDPSSRRTSVMTEVPTYEDG